MVMIETAFVVPVLDNAGRPFPASTWRTLRQRLIEFGGYTEMAESAGVWRSGRRTYRDVNRTFVVALASWWDLPRLLELVDWAWVAFGQEAIYVRNAGISEIRSARPRTE
jgi:hypothetical protein